MVPGPLFLFTGPRSVAQVQHVAKIQQVGGLRAGGPTQKKNQGSGFVGGLRAGGPTHFYLYKGSQIMDLVACGLKTEPIVGGLHISEIVKFLNGLGAKAPSP